MKRMPKKKKPISAEAIARMADQGKDVTRFFTGGRMMNPIQRVNVDFTAEMLQELDEEAAGLNIRRPGHQNPRSRGLGQAISPAGVFWREILARPWFDQVPSSGDK
jgi:hypothetical protein